MGCRSLLGPCRSDPNLHPVWSTVQCQSGPGGVGLGPLPSTATNMTNHKKHQKSVSRLSETLDLGLMTIGDTPIYIQLIGPDVVTPNGGLLGWFITTGYTGIPSTILSDLGQLR